MSTYLERNLAALADRDPRLAERVAWPVASDHVRERDGASELRWRQAWHRLDVPPERARSAGPRVFGVGLGEAVDAALARGEVCAWERDPWLLRLALARHDWATAIESGALRLLLGADVRAFGATEGPWVHPLLGQVYARELALARAVPARGCVFVATGDLFVDDLADCLDRLGYACYSIDVDRLSPEEIGYAVDRLAPRFLGAIGDRRGLAEFCAARSLASFVWEIDPTTDAPAAPNGSVAGFFVFTYRRALAEAWMRAGYDNVEYLPLCANVERRLPAGDPGERYAAPAAFVGSSMLGKVESFRRAFLDAFAKWRGRADGAALGEAILAEALAAQRGAPDRYLLPEVLRARVGAFLEEAAGPHRPLALAAEIAACEKRLGTVAALGPEGVHVWGDRGWKSVERFGARYRGPAGHAGELNRVYSGARVNVDIGRLYQNDIAPMRIFDVLACGGYLLAEHNGAVAELFDVGAELDTWRTPAELRSKVRAALDDESRRRAVAARGRRAVLERHAMDARVAHIVSRVDPGAVWAGPG